jgi:hypothetical protein
VCSVAGNRSVLADDTFLSSITDHANNKTMGFNRMVQHFAAENKFYHFMPQGLSKVFPRLLGIEIINSRLKVIRMKDMQPFAHLGYLNLRANDIECLDGDVFRYNRRLLFVSLRHNNIRRIDARIFETLKQVQQFWLVGNHCISQNAMNGHEVASLVRGINVNCAPPAYGDSRLPVKCEQLIEREKEVVTRLRRELEAEVRRNEELSVEIMGLRAMDEH